MQKHSKLVIPGATKQLSTSRAAVSTARFLYQRQSSYDNEGFITQLGGNQNKARIEQMRGSFPGESSFNSASVTQGVSNNNEAAVFQYRARDDDNSGISNKATINQNVVTAGGSNTATITQGSTVAGAAYSDNNVGTINQSGSFASATLSQIGIGNNGTITQSGAGTVGAHNIAVATQDGTNTLTITQTQGVPTIGNTAMVNQVGMNNQAIVQQTAMP